MRCGLSVTGSSGGDGGSGSGSESRSSDSFNRSPSQRLSTEAIPFHCGLADNSRPTSQMSSSSTGNNRQPPTVMPAAEEGDGSAADFGVGSTVLTRNAQHDEFEIHTVGRLAKRGDKVRRR